MPVMAPENDTTCLVRRLRNGDDAVRNELIRHACERLRSRSRQMRRSYADLRGIEQTDDVLQDALIRLNREFGRGRPLESGQHLWNRATLLIRRALLDLARKHRGRNGERPRQLSGRDDVEGEPMNGLADGGGGPQSLEEWTEFHEQVGALPEAEREMFGLRWYGGLSHEEAGTILGVSEREVKRRWQSARCLLFQRLKGLRPE